MRVRRKPIKNTVVLVLAAGQSRRMGKPKQKLVFNGQSLLCRTVSEALSSGIGKVYIVTGYNSRDIQDELEGMPVVIVYNEHWQNGMGSSIAAGLSVSIEKEANPDGVLLMVCDQPFVTAGLLKAISVRRAEPGTRIVASEYGNAFGPPVYFSADFFPELLKLNTDSGAKSLISAHINETSFVFFEKGAIDIDTESDYQMLVKQGG